MARPKRWEIGKIVNGVQTIELNHWTYLYEYVNARSSALSGYIWRGQASSAWKLETSLDRQLSKLKSDDRARDSKKHLDRFKLATRGRRGETPPRLQEENEWWALGQHQGLVTPLLDWSLSPFVALYFAFYFEALDKPKNERAVWALGSIDRKIEELREDFFSADIPDTDFPLEIVRPQQDENARLVNQAGLFTRVPLGLTVERWIEGNFADDSRVARLLKFTIPDTDRDECLKSLNSMNINHLTLFPDLFGAAEHCNVALKNPEL